MELEFSKLCKNYSILNGHNYTIGFKGAWIVWPKQVWATFLVFEPVSGQLDTMYGRHDTLLD